MLTDMQCRTARPKEKLYRLNDFNGLYFDVKPNGKKAWRYWFKLNGKSSMFTLGEYPIVKLAEACEKLLLGCSTKSLLHHLVYLRDQRHIPSQK